MNAKAASQAPTLLQGVQQRDPMAVPTSCCWSAIEQLKIDTEEL